MNVNACHHPADREVRNAPCGCKVYACAAGHEQLRHLAVYGCLLAA